MHTIDLLNNSTTWPIQYNVVSVLLLYEYLNYSFDELVFKLEWYLNDSAAI